MQKVVEKAERIWAKKLIISFFLLFNLLQITAQNSTGKVVDSNHSIALSGVRIIDSDYSTVSVTDQNGSFTIPVGTYTFVKKGYFSKTHTISNTQFVLIELESQAQNLDEVRITSDSFQSRLKTLSTAISVIPVKEIKSNNNIHIAPILNTISGVFMHSATLTTNRITLRGIGSRNLYGTSKIRAYYQEIPLTNGSGESTIEDIEMQALGRIEIIKGPSSSRYGAGLGGTIRLIPDKGQFGKTFVKSNAVVGSYGMQKLLLQGNFGNSTNRANFVFSNLHSDGYRENNNTNRRAFTLTTHHFLNDTNQLVFVGNYIDLKAFIPSSIDENTYVNHPEAAAITWKNAEGFEDYKKGLFGLSWQHQYLSKTTHYISVFTSFLDSYEPRPFNILQEKTHAFGLRAKFLFKNKVFDKLLQWMVGCEGFNDKNAYQTFANLYRNFPSGTGSVQGDMLSDLKENHFYYNLFFDSKYKLSENTVFNFGLNWNHTSYTLKDQFTADGTDLTGNYNFNAILSPKWGLTRQLDKNAMLYGTISHGFSPPTLEETLLPDHQINTEIKPESGWNYEIGSRGTILNEKLIYDIALYQMNVKNLLVARRTSDDEFVGINAGKTLYRGVEVMLNYPLIKRDRLSVTHTQTINYRDFKFREFIDMGKEYSGNKLPGVPQWTYYSALHFTSDFGFYGWASYRSVDKMPLRDDNSVYAEKYQLVNVKMGYNIARDKGISIDTFAGINNVLNEKYASMLLINASSFGESLPRYYYPGKPINYYAGIDLKYSF